MTTTSQLTRSQPRSLLSTIVLALLGMSINAQAGTITWGGGQLSHNYSSDGTDLEVGTSGSVGFELGIFQNKSDGTVFTPTLSNAADWAANWVPFGPATGSQSDYLTPLAGRAAAVNQNYYTGTLSTGTSSGAVPTFAEGNNSIPATQVTQGRQVYIWGYNSMTPSSTTEWLLFTGTGSGDSSNNNWVVPSQASGNDTFELQWDVASANTAVVGNIPGSTGSGEKTDEPLTQISDVQFATVPEPGSALLTALGLLSLAGIRRRS